MTDIVTLLSAGMCSMWGATSISHGNLARLGLQRRRPSSTRAQGTEASTPTTPAQSKLLTGLATLGSVSGGAAVFCCVFKTHEAVQRQGKRFEDMSKRLEMLTDNVEAQIKDLEDDWKAQATQTQEMKVMKDDLKEMKDDLKVDFKEVRDNIRALTSKLEGHVSWKAVMVAVVVFVLTKNDTKWSAALRACRLFGQLNVLASAHRLRRIEALDTHTSAQQCYGGVQTGEHERIVTTAVVPSFVGPVGVNHAVHVCLAEVTLTDIVTLHSLQGCVGSKNNQPQLHQTNWLQLSPPELQLHQVRQPKRKIPPRHGRQAFCRL